MVMSPPSDVEPGQVALTARLGRIVQIAVVERLVVRVGVVPVGSVAGVAVCLTDDHLVVVVRARSTAPRTSG